MIEFCQLPFRFDAARLRGDLERVPRDVWREHYAARDYRGEWTVLPLRSVGGRAGLIQSTILPPDQFRETKVLLASPYFQEVLETLACPMCAVRLMRLGAGSEIKEHADSSVGYEDGHVRLHIPVQTHSQVEFYLNGQRVAMQEGECWYLNFNLPHRVVNASPIDRIHLVIDCNVNPWLEGVFASLGFAEAEKQGPSPVWHR